MSEVKPLWECPDCGKQERCDPTASDDWGDEEVAVGPTCDECEEEMQFVADPKPITFIKLW